MRSFFSQNLDQKKGGKTWTNREGSKIIRTRQESSMIHLASLQSRPAVIVAGFWSFVPDGRTDGRTNNMCENSDHYRPGLWSASWITKKKANLGDAVENVKKKFRIIWTWRGMRSKRTHGHETAHTQRDKETWSGVPENMCNIWFLFVCSKEMTLLPCVFWQM